MTLTEKKEATLLLMQYAVNPEDLRQARHLVEKYENDHIALNIFHEFYSYLPEAENDAILILRKLDHKEGTFLIAVSTKIDHYLYLATREEAIFLGTKEDGIWDQEVLDFFGWTRETALKKHSDLDTFPLYVPAYLDQRLCSICSVAHGENHRLGCPIEICPWCEGQLTNCNCRFEQAGKNLIQNENQLDTFLEKLERKGRIPFDASDQGLTFSGNSKK